MTSVLKIPGLEMFLFVVMRAASTDNLGYLQVLHKAILVSPWEGREWPY